MTAAQEGWKITVVVLDNGGYGSISTLARTQTGASIGNERRRRGATGGCRTGRSCPVDFAANARSMGCEGVRADTLDELRDALAAARAGSAPTVIVCPIADRPLPRRRRVLGPRRPGGRGARRDAGAQRRPPRARRAQRHY